jgi:small subunit ribosomal protein S1
MSNNDKVNWPDVFQTFMDETIVQAKIIEYTGKGFRALVMGLESYLPNIHKTMGIDNPEDIVGMEIPVFITKIMPLNNTISVSYNKSNEERAQAKETIKTIEVGSIWQGIIKNVASYGLFVTIAPGVDGLIHVKEVSWSKDYDFAKRYHIGDEISVKVIEIKGDRISLSHKQLLENPWETLDPKYKEGVLVKGIVRQLADYGAFVEIEPGVEALLHKTEIDWFDVDNIRDIFAIGDIVEAVIVNLDRGKHKMAVSTKVLKEDPWADVETNYPVGSVHTGIIKSIVNYGVFISISPGIEGLLHSTELIAINGTFKKENYHKGDQVKIQIKYIDKDNRQLNFSLYQQVPVPEKKRRPRIKDYRK